MQDKNDDVLAFMAEMSDVKPLAQTEHVTITAQETSLAQKLKREALEREEAKLAYQLTLELQEYLDPYDLLTHKQDGIQEGVYKNLRLGKYPIENRVSLLKMSLAEARERLIQVIEKAYEKGQRVILIQHGLGLNSQPKPGKLKSYINVWLAQFPQVIAFHSAHKQHGGSGNTYVMLKKNPQQKLINREKHQKRY